MDKKPVEDKGVPRPLLPTDLDAQDYVTVWDNGPRASRNPDQRTEHPATHAGGSGLPAGDATPKETEADAEWHRKNGPGPVAMRMHATEAKQAMENDPLRYTMEPLGLDEGAVAAKIKEIQEHRAALEKAAAEDAAATQRALDRKEAVGALMVDHTADVAAEKDEELKSKSAKLAAESPLAHKPAPKFGSQTKPKSK